MGKNTEYGPVGSLLGNFLDWRDAGRDAGRDAMGIRERHGMFVLGLRALLREHGARLTAQRTENGDGEYTGMEVDVEFAGQGSPSVTGESGPLDIIRVVELLNRLDGKAVDNSDRGGDRAEAETPYLDALCGKMVRSQDAGPGVRVTYRGFATYRVQTSIHRYAWQNLQACLRAIGVLAGAEDYLDAWCERLAREHAERNVGPRGTKIDDENLVIERYRSYGHDA